MKTFFLSLIWAMCNSVSATAQNPYITETDPKHTEEIIVTGIISKYLLQNNRAFTWYGSNYNAYTPSTGILNSFESARDKVSLVVFGGTWCDDSRFILPKLFRIQEMSGMDDKKISFFGVNRKKEMVGNLTKALNITNVPTIIVMKDGKEIGRVVEYGKTGKWDVELAEIVQSAL